MTITVSRLYRDLPICAFLITLATVFDFSTFDNINYLFIGCSTLGIVALLSFHFKSAPKPGNEVLFLIYFFMILITLWNYSTLRWTSLIYSGFFVITFFFYSPFVKQYFSVGQFRKLLKGIFYLYFAGLIVAQLDVYFNFFAPLSGIIGFMRGSFGTIFEKDGLRYFSLSSEPSYASFIVIGIFYTYFKLDTSKKPLLNAENLINLVMLLYMMIMFKSAYGVILLGLIVLDVVGFSSTLLVMAIVVLGTFAFIIIFDFDIRAINRIVNIAKTIDLSNPHSLFAIDFTAYYRVAPVLHFIETIDLTDMHCLLGYGAGASRLFIVPEIYGGYIHGEFLGGFLPCFFYDYGMIGGAMVVLFLLRQVPSFFSFPTATLALMLLNANFNTQLFWFLVFCFHMLKFYQTEVQHEYRATQVLTAS